MVPGTTHTGMQIVSEKKKNQLAIAKKTTLLLNTPTFRRFKRGNPCGTHTLQKDQNLIIVNLQTLIMEPQCNVITHLPRFVQFGFVLYNCHEYLNLIRMSLMEGERGRGVMEKREREMFPVQCVVDHESDLLTCIDDAIENALGWSMGMRSNRYGNGMLALDEGKSLKTSRIVLLGRLQ